MEQWQNKAVEKAEMKMKIRKSNKYRISIIRIFMNKKL